MCILQPCADPQEEGVWWRDDTSWKKYESALQSQIRNGVSSGLKAIDLGTIKSSVHPNGARYTVNLQKMEQVAVSSGQIRPIKIIDRQAVQAVVKKTPPQLVSASFLCFVSLESKVSRCLSSELPHSVELDIPSHLDFLDLRLVHLVQPIRGFKACPDCLPACTDYGTTPAASAEESGNSPLQGLVWCVETVRPGHRHRVAEGNRQFSEVAVYHELQDRQKFFF